MGQLVFQAALGGAVNLIGPNISATTNFTLPGADGTNGQALTTNGSGVLGFSSIVSGAAGSNTQVQFNSGGNFGASSSLTWDGTTFSTTGLSASSTVTLSGGTANGVTYLNGSKVLTSGSALTFDGTNLATTGNITLSNNKNYQVKNSAGTNQTLLTLGSDDNVYFGQVTSPSAANVYYYGLNQIFNSGSTEGMRLTSTGLGIGTSSPAAKLDVTGGSSTGGFIVNGSVASVRASSTVIDMGDSNRFMALGPNTTTAGTFKFIVASSNASVYTTAATLDSSGNLGLGVTPSAWSSIFRAQQIGAGNSFIAGRTDSVAGRQIQLGTNAYYNGTNWIYGLSQPAAKYYLNDNTHVWEIAASGTAGNAISFTQAMTLNSSGELLLGTTSSATSTCSIQAKTSGYSIWSINDATLNYSQFYFGGTATSGFQFIRSDGRSGGWLAFGTQDTERARIDSSGNFCYGVNSFSAASNGFLVSADGSSTYTAHANGTSSGATYSFFYYNNSAIGSITQSGTTAVLYNTTSDQRLKENIVNAPEFGSVIDSIQVRSFDWKTDGTHQRAGFVAQELVTVAPEAVHQPKDTEEMMAVDYSKLVPMLVKEIQSLRARVAQLETN